MNIMFLLQNLDGDLDCKISEIIRYFKTKFSKLIKYNYYMYSNFFKSN